MVPYCSLPSTAGGCFIFCQVAFRGLRLDILDTLSFPSIVFGDSTVSATDPAALSSGGTTKTTLPADGETSLLLRLNVTGSGNANFSINGTGDPTVDGQLYDPIAGGGPGQSSTLTVQTVNGQAFALYLAPIAYTKNTNDKSGQRSLTIFAGARGQGLGQDLTIQRVNPPTLLSEAEKTQFYILGLYLSQVADAFDGASMVADGPKNLALNIGIATFVKALAKVTSGNDQIFGQELEFSAGLG